MQHRTAPLHTPTAVQVIGKASLARSRARYRLHSEMDIHSSLRHDSIVAYHGFLQDRTNVYLLLEPCSEL